MKMSDEDKCPHGLKEDCFCFQCAKEKKEKEDSDIRREEALKRVLDRADKIDW